MSVQIAAHCTHLRASPGAVGEGRFNYSAERRPDMKESGTPRCVVLGQASWGLIGLVLHRPTQGDDYNMVG